MIFLRKSSPKKKFVKIHQTGNQNIRFKTLSSQKLNSKKSLKKWAIIISKHPEKINVQLSKKLCSYFAINETIFGISKNKQMGGIHYKNCKFKIFSFYHCSSCWNPFYQSCVISKEYGIEGRYNWRGPPYHMIIHALQTGTQVV